MKTLLLLFALCGSLWTTIAMAEESKYAIVIHGGAGSAPRNQEWRDQRQQTLDEALSLGKEMLSSGKGSLETVEAVVRVLEDSPYFNAGKGAVLNAAGTHELDATIMDGRDRSAGAVGGVTVVKNPISLARKVMVDTKHILLASDGADQFAVEHSDDPQIEVVSNDYFTTEHQQRRLDRIKRQQKQAEADAIGTVGCVALDRQGNIAAATSTGGLNNKSFGRLGDSPIVGAGTFADNATCGVSCTGIGEDFMRHVVAYDISARIAYGGQRLAEAVDAILTDDQHEVRGGIIAIDHTGEIVMRFNTEGMARAAADSNGRFEIRVAK